MTALEQRRHHPRTFHDNRFVYPVLSRRSQGLSVGINLNPDKVCNFDCIYCQVDRTSQAETRFVELDAVLEELDDLLAMVTSDNQILVHRLSWQKLFTISGIDHPVKCVAWRPDGKRAKSTRDTQ